MKARMLKHARRGTFEGKLCGIVSIILQKAVGNSRLFFFCSLYFPACITPSSSELVWVDDVI